jgi:hypothetical protein
MPDPDRINAELQTGFDAAARFKMRIVAFDVCSPNRGQGADYPRIKIAVASAIRYQPKIVNVWVCT